MNKKNLQALVVLIICLANLVSAQNNLVELKINTSAVCEMCKETLEKAMAYEKGVKTANLDVKSAVLTIQYNPQKTSPEKIRKAISETGYDADNILAKPKAYNNLNPCCKKDAHPKQD